MGSNGTGAAPEQPDRSGVRFNQVFSDEVGGVAVGLLFVCPLALTLAPPFVGAGVAISAAAAVASATAGLLLERWLLFAEARHVCMLAYGAGRMGQGRETSASMNLPVDTASFLGIAVPARIRPTLELCLSDHSYVPLVDDPLADWVASVAAPAFRALRRQSERADAFDAACSIGTGSGSTS